MAVFAPLSRSAGLRAGPPGAASVHPRGGGRNQRRPVRLGYATQTAASHQPGPDLTPILCSRRCMTLCNEGTLLVALPTAEYALAPLAPPGLGWRRSTGSVAGWTSASLAGRAFRADGRCGGAAYSRAC